MVTTPLFDDPLVLATAPGPPASPDRRRVSVRDLDGLDLVMFREGYDLRAVTLAACRAAGVEPHLVSEGGEMAGVLSFVAAGLGAAVVPAIALPDDGSLVGIPFVGPTLSRTVALAQRGDRALARPRAGRAAPAVSGTATGGPARSPRPIRRGPVRRVAKLPGLFVRRPRTTGRADGVTPARSGRRAVPHTRV